MKKLVPAFMLLVFTLAFSGCEMPPEPVQISEAQYRHLTCDEMSQEQLRIKSALAAARDAQRGRSDYGMGRKFQRCANYLQEQRDVRDRQAERTASAGLSKLPSRKAVPLLESRTIIIVSRTNSQ